MHARVANLFDKTFIHWACTQWQHFENTQDIHGVALVSWLLKEVMLIIQYTRTRGSSHDRFVCHALAQELCLDNENCILQLHVESMKHFDVANSCQDHLAQLVEGLHACISVIRQLDGRKLHEEHDHDFYKHLLHEHDLKTMFDRRIVRHHIRFLGTLNDNVDAVNTSIISFLTSMRSHGNEEQLFRLSFLEIMVQVAKVNDPMKKFGSRVTLRAFATSLISRFIQPLMSIAVDRAAHSLLRKRLVKCLFADTP